MAAIYNFREQSRQISKCSIFGHVNKKLIADAIDKLWNSSLSSVSLQLVDDIHTQLQGGGDENNNNVLRQSLIVFQRKIQSN